MSTKLLLFFFLLIFEITPVISQNNPLQNFTLIDVPADEITGITQDNIGYLWLATKSNGIIQFDGNKFTNYTIYNGLNTNKINTVFSKKDTLFIGTDKGLSIKYNHKITNLKCPKVNAILAVNNIVFLATKQGIYHLKNGIIKPLKIIYDIDLNYINTIKFNKNYFWIGTKTALWRVNSLTKPKLIKKVNNNNYTALLFHNNKTIAASYEHGIKLISDGKIIKTIATIKQINTISFIGKQLWIATENNGITILNTQDFSFIRQTNKYNNTLKTNKIKQVFQDKQENIWILGKKLYNSKTEKKTSKNPQLFFENIEVSYQSLDSIDINSYTKPFALQATQNNISFSYKTVNLNYPKSVQYRWKLNKMFSSWSNNNNIHFANLKAGNYTFIAQSRNQVKEESKPIQFSFFIDTPLYKKGWFRVSIATVFLLILFLIIQQYIKQLKKKNKQKIEKLELENHLQTLEQKALQLQMSPHFIFNILNGIKALGNTGNTVKLNTTISKFAVLLRSILNNSRKDEITVAQEIETLKNYIELEQEFNKKNFEYLIKTDTNTIDLEEILIPPMLVQPFVENSIKHGFTNAIKNGKLSISFTIKYRFLHCTIEDNGVGYQPLKNNIDHQSMALKITKERIENLIGKNNFTIEKIKGNNTTNGTKVWFKIPLKTDY